MKNLFIHNFFIDVFLKVDIISSLYFITLQMFSFYYLAVKHDLNLGIRANRSVNSSHHGSRYFLDFKVGDERYFVTWLIGQVWTCLKWNKRVDSFLIGFKFRYGYDILGSAVEFFVCGSEISVGTIAVMNSQLGFIN